MKEKINAIVDWKREWILTLCLISAVGFPLCFNMAGIINGILTTTGVELNALDPGQQIVLGLGNPAISIFLLLIGLYHIRKLNKEYALKQTRREITQHCYFGYWFCRKVLGIKTVSLIHVPIPMQFKLVCRKLFEVYLCDEGIKDIDEDKETIIEQELPGQRYPNEINLILADTYPINVKTQTFKSCRKRKTYIVARTTTDRARRYSVAFKNAVITRVRSLPNSVDTIHVFATMNPKHCYSIAKEAFCTGGRDSIKHLYVHQQDSTGNRRFEKQGIKIF